MEWIRIAGTGGMEQDSRNSGMEQVSCNRWNGTDSRNRLARSGGLEQGSCNRSNGIGEIKQVTWYRGNGTG